MLSLDSLQVAEEEVVESSSNKLGDIYAFVAKGCFPQTMNPLRKKNLKRYAQKFMFDGKRCFKTQTTSRGNSDMTDDVTNVRLKTWQNESSFASRQVYEV